MFIHTRLIFGDAGADNREENKTGENGARAQSRSQSPRYPYPAAGTGNKDLWDKAFRHDKILGLPVLQRMYSTPCFKGTHTRFLDFRFYCACKAERFIPEVLSVACFCRWIRLTRTLGTRLDPNGKPQPEPGWTLWHFYRVCNGLYQRG